jgi:hypothetical protein
MSKNTKEIRNQTVLMRCDVSQLRELQRHLEKLPQWSASYWKKRVSRVIRLAEVKIMKRGSEM